MVVTFLKKAMSVLSRHGKVPSRLTSRNNMNQRKYIKHELSYPMPKSLEVAATTMVNVIFLNF
jgi:hypothetical protein